MFESSFNSFSDNPDKLVVINDDNWLKEILAPDGMSTGYKQRNYEEHPLAGLAASSEFPLPVIPESEWEDRIKEQEVNKSGLQHLRKRAGIESLNQNGTNYCWCNAVVQAVHYIRAANGQPLVRLSPASVAAPIKNFRNQGGWGSQALEYITEHGVAAQSLWPPNAIDRKYYTEEAKENAKKHIITEWWDLKPKNRDELFSCLFYGVPVAVGYNWWGHEVLAIAVLIKNGKFVLLIDNSWGNWGDKGLGILEGSKILPNEAVAPYVLSPSQV